MKLNRLIAASVVGFSLLTTSTSAFACEHESHSWSWFGWCNHSDKDKDNDKDPDHERDHDRNHDRGHDCNGGGSSSGSSGHSTGGGTSTGGGGGSTTPPVGPKG